MTTKRQRVKIKPIMTSEEFATLADVLVKSIQPKQKQHERGWVGVSANAAGRSAIEAVFPGAGVHWWFEDGYFGPEWAGVLLNVPRVMAMFPNHRLPLEITEGADLSELTPDAIAFLLAAGARRNGARVGMIDAAGTFVFLQSLREH
jgi:hypothetical protein